jgi:hypothetical protein
LIHGDIAVLPEQVRFFAEFADKEVATSFRRAQTLSA